jgi:agmatinase
VGLRKIENKELEFLKEKGIRYFEMRNIESKEDVCDSIMESSQGKNLYLSIDIDVVDPAFAPGTGYLEPGGFSSQEILYFSRRLKKLKNLRALDITEVQEDNLVTVKLASRILEEFM